MPKYLITGSYSPEGARGVAKEGGPSAGKLSKMSRVPRVARSRPFYFAFGSDDFYVICDLPDNEAAARPA
jgi:uncharacterized protein with GYD domain